METSSNLRETAPLLSQTPRPSSAAIRPPLLHHRTISSLSLASTQTTAEEATRNSFYGLLLLVGLMLVAGVAMLVWHTYPGLIGGVRLPAVEAWEERLDCSLPPEIIESLGEGELPEFVPYPYDD